MRYLKLFFLVGFLVILFSLVGFPSAFSDITLGVNGNRAIYTEDGAAIITSGRTFDIVLIQGTDATSGAYVDIYWDIVSEWNATNGIGYLASATGTNAGTFSINITIPSTSVGPHYVWIQDYHKKNTVRSNVFYILPTIQLDSYTGYIEDKVEVNGYGFEQDSKIYIKSANNSDVKIIGDSKVKTDLAGYFTCNIRVPVSDYGI